MAKDLFSVPIFFIAFRETLEAAIIVSVLLGLAEQIVYEDPGRLTHAHTITSTNDESRAESGEEALEVSDEDRRRLIRKLRIQVRCFEAHLKATDHGLDLCRCRYRSLHCAVRRSRVCLFTHFDRFGCSLSCRFIAVWFTQAADLWSSTEELWEGTVLPVLYFAAHPFPGIFDIIASLMIFVMGVSMLKMDRGTISACFTSFRTSCIVYATSQGKVAPQAPTRLRWTYSGRQRRQSRKMGPSHSAPYHRRAGRQVLSSALFCFRSPYS